MPAAGGEAHDPKARREFREQIEREIFGRRHDSFDVDRIAKLAAALASSQYAQARMQKAKRCRNGMEILAFALEQVSVKGLYLEFGVFSGKSINHSASCRPNETIYGFDSFEGLPETWRQGFKKGAFQLENLPAVKENVKLVPGWFDRSLPVFCDEHPDEPVAFLHVDCDLYSSTQTIFALLRTRIVPGTIIAFNEYFNYPGWEQHEIKAFMEFCSSYNVSVTNISPWWRTISRWLCVFSAPVSKTKIGGDEPSPPNPPSIVEALSS